MPLREEAVAASVGFKAVGLMAGRYHPGCCSSKDGGEPSGVAMVST